jgi:Fur family peroxide stress response transcriptional regulator
MGGELAEEALEERLQRVVNELRRQGLRVTAQRIAIARIVLESIKDHPSFMEILEKARKEIPNISPSTVYNNLQLLEKLGFIRSFSVKGETRYDNAYKHVNVVCTESGKVYDLEGEDTKKILDTISKKIGTEIENVIVYAKC